MGSTRFAGGLPLLLIILLAAVVGCTRPPPPAEALLLTPADFPERALQATAAFEPNDMPGGGQAAQTVLAGEDYRVFQSVVVFAEEEAARNAFEAVRLGGVGAGWDEASGLALVGDEAVVFTGRQGADPAAQIVFRTGRVLERITIVGSDDPSQVAEIARRAAAKIGG